MSKPLLSNLAPLLGQWQNLVHDEVITGIGCHVVWSGTFVSENVCECCSRARWMHGAWAWSRVAAELRQRGGTSIAVDLPFTGFAEDVSVVRDAIDHAGAEAVVCGHSYGGLVIRTMARHANNIAEWESDHSPFLSRPSDLADILVASGRST